MTGGSTISSPPILHHQNPITTTLLILILIILLTRPPLASIARTKSRPPSAHQLVTPRPIHRLLLHGVCLPLHPPLLRRREPHPTRNPVGSVFLARRTGGLDDTIIETFPVLNYVAVKELKIGKYALECAVCLTEFDDDDTLRLLPHCDHVFHPQCIDPWLQAHTTCPICRADLHEPIPPHAPPYPEDLPPTDHDQEVEHLNPCIEQPLQRAPIVMRRNASFGRPRRLWGRIARHVAVKQWENLERFRLRSPEKVRKDVMSGKLQRATSMVVYLPRETSSRRGYRTRFGEGSSRGQSGSLRSDRRAFSFLSRALLHVAEIGGVDKDRCVAPSGLSPLGCRMGTAGLSSKLKELMYTTCVSLLHSPPPPSLTQMHFSNNIIPTMTGGSIISSRPILHHQNPITTTLLILLLTRPAFAQHSPTTATDPNNELSTISPSTGVVILVLITAFFFMGFISLYIRHCSSDDENPARPGNPGGSVFLARRTRGLDDTIIETFPVLNYAAVKELKIGKYALECAVCLTEFDDDDALRLLPHCDHVFHPECIDKWLQAHTTCPVCRADLHAPILPHAPQHTEDLPPTDHHQEVEDLNPCIEQPLQRAPTVMRRNASFGRPRRLWGRIARSFSTGHVAVKQWENLERFRLRLPEEVRKEVMSGKLQRAASMVVYLPRETSSRRGDRTGFGEGSSRGRSGSLRSDRRVFSFFSRALSFTSPKLAAADNSRQGSLRGSVRAESTRLPV
ncbi:LOW QUALITY PROTEIN: hypothetical protein Cgig2_003436 [Carnegiea gigantea]|uniref:RING-type E3 ubiquitin transferase n=1 Tax=Carnegiea gigantea TaxID=171969 RepID=A0A9Q1K9U8_9CARY|nr:LOW QUALITY PROTEIN: hypothetical protein Cgig2_003436 [Carnegiea gigantea]